MNTILQRLFLISLTLTFGGCVASYTLVPAGKTQVAKKTMMVSPGSNWNRTPRSRTQIKAEESWTKNGPILDSITFVGGIEDGAELAKYNFREERRIPVFRSNMTPPDFVSMVESNYRIRGGVSVFTMTNMEPVMFLGVAGIQMDYDFIGGDDVKRKGRTVLSVFNDKLYMMSLDGTALHYFAAALPEFEAMVAEAGLL
ncbi:MAG: hypothetical protein AB8G16_15030 [Gammaproteobacteria bacterium]